MAEVLAEFSDPVVSSDGRSYRAQATGALMPDGKWEGWIEFAPIDGGEPLRSPRETTQPNRVDALYWATGLTRVYLEGALGRALHPLVQHVPAASKPLFKNPARDSTTVVDRPAIARDAVLDPFSVYGKGETLLRKELGALSAWHLVNIIEAYQLSAESAAVLNRMTPASLVEIIVAGVRAQSPVR